jgi:hypothetical protein
LSPISAEKGCDERTVGASFDEASSVRPCGGECRGLSSSWALNAAMGPE